MSEQTQKAIAKADAIVRDLDLPGIRGFTDFHDLDHIASFYDLQDHIMLLPGDITKEAMQSQYLKMLARIKVSVDEEIARVERQWGVRLKA